VKWFLLTVLALIVTGLLFGGFLVAHIFTARSGNSKPVELRVEQGEPFSAVVRKLRAQRVIPNDKLFSLWARLTGSDKKFYIAWLSASVSF
jgi:cell division protein YceG involved in septum cleavage